MFRILKLTFKSLALAFCLLSLILNIAIFTVSGAYTAVSTAIAGMGVATAATREVTERVAKKKAKSKIAKQTTGRLTKRITKSASRSIGTSAGEAIPFVGVAVIAGGLALEVNDACTNARDIAGLEAALETEADPELARQSAYDSFDCKTLIPGYDDLPTREALWISVKSAPTDAWNSSLKYIDSLPEVPDLSFLGKYFENALDTGEDWIDYTGEGLSRWSQSLGDSAKDNIARIKNWWDGELDPKTEVPFDSR